MRKFWNRFFTFVSWLSLALCLATFWYAANISRGNPFASCVALTALCMIALKLVAYGRRDIHHATPRGNLWWMLSGFNERYTKPRELGSRIDWQHAKRVTPVMVITTFMTFGYLTMCGLLQKPDLLKMGLDPLIRFFVLMAPLTMFASDVLHFVYLGEWQRPARVPSPEML